MKSGSALLIGSPFILIFCNVVFHVRQKAIPHQVHPIESMILTFLIALVISILILRSDKSDLPRLKENY